MKYNLYRAIRPTGFHINLSKRRCWYADDPPPASDDATPTDPPETPPAKTGDTGPGTPAFTQADVDRIVGERAKRAKETAVNELLKELGFEKADDLKMIIDTERQRKEQEMSEVEKLQTKIQQLETQTQEAKAAQQQAEQAALATRRDSAIMTALVGVEKPQSVLTLLQTEHTDQVAAVLTDAGTVDDKAVTQLVEIAKQDYAGMFTKQNGGPGTGSHSGGKTPTGNKDRERIGRQSAQKALKVGGF